MKQINRTNHRVAHYYFILVFLLVGRLAFGQDAVAEKPADKPVKNTFESALLIDNQSVMVPIKGTLEFDIQHRFGTVNNGKKDIWGIIAPSNIRLGLSYAPINRLTVGAGLTKERIQFDFNAKYAIIQQTRSGKVPVSLTAFANMVVDARDKSKFLYGVNRLSYFSQLIIARKITEKFSAQVAPSLSWYNNIEAYLDSKGQIREKMDHANFSIALSGRYKLTDKTAVIAGYDQPLTQNYTDNPQPNLSLGIELSTSSHAFQIFVGNYYGIVPQSNNVYNQNDYRKGHFLIGFNITRLWNY